MRGTLMGRYFRSEIPRYELAQRLLICHLFLNAYKKFQSAKPVDSKTSTRKMTVYKVAVIQLSPEVCSERPRLIQPPGMF